MRMERSRSPGQTRHHGLARRAEHVDRQTREEPVPDIEALRHAIEREGDERLVRGARRVGMRQRALEQFAADALSLQHR